MSCLAAGVLQYRKLYITLIHLKVTRKVVGIYISFHFAGTACGSGQGRQQPVRVVAKLAKAVATTWCLLHPTAAVTPLCCGVEQDALSIKTLQTSILA